MLGLQPPRSHRVSLDKMHWLRLLKLRRALSLKLLQRPLDNGLGLSPAFGELLIQPRHILPRLTQDLAFFVVRHGFHQDTFSVRRRVGRAVPNRSTS